MNEFFWTAIPFTHIPIVAVVAVVGLWAVLRNRATALASSAAFDAKVGHGRPVVVEFFSNM